MYCMYLAECVCIDATNNFCCRKYKQIHTIQTNTDIIHTPILPTYIQKYIQNKSVTMCIYVYLCACICMYMPMCIYVYVLLCYYVYLCACIYMIWCASCMCMYLHVSVCINWLSLFTRGYMCAVGLHWALRVAERTRRDHLFWNFVLFFKGRQPGSLWAKPWPTCWCSTGGCLSRARHADRTGLPSWRCQCILSFKLPTSWPMHTLDEFFLTGQQILTDTYTYIQYRHIHTLANLRKSICHDLGQIT